MSGGAPPTPAARMSIGAIAMMIVGALLLLPGLCTIVFAVLLVKDNPAGAFADPYVRFFIPFMLLCLLVSVGGILLIVAARRRRRGGDGDGDGERGQP